jgi:hypothetical protein
MYKRAILCVIEYHLRYSKKELFMKNFSKLFGITVLVTVIGFSVIGCKTDEDDNEYELFNGDWDSGGYVVTFNDGKGIFKELYGGIWLDGKNTGQIKIGEQCYRNFVKSGDRKWTGEIRIYNTYPPHQTLRWEDITITLSADGQTFNMGGWNLTRK